MFSKVLNYAFVDWAVNGCRVLIGDVAQQHEIGDEEAGS